MEHLRQVGHDVVWAAEAEGPGDERLLSLAFDQDRVLVTLDTDFGELAVVFGRPHAGIVRIVEVSPAAQGSLVDLALRNFAEDLVARAIVTVEPERVRIRRMDDE